MVAVVNGYVCFTTCDAKQAKQGKDPLALTGAAQGEDSKHKSGLNGQPATILGGALKDLANALDPTKSGDPSNPAPNNSPSGDTGSPSRVDVFA
jgi:hypothetical protein